MLSVSANIRIKQRISERTQQPTIRQSRAHALCTLSRDTQKARYTTITGWVYSTGVNGSE